MISHVVWRWPSQLQTGTVTEPSPAFLLSPYVLLANVGRAFTQKPLDLGV